MDLDFTALDKIALQTAQKDFTEPIEEVQGNLALQPQKPARSENRAPQEVHTHQLDKEAQERARLREVYHQQQENIRRAGKLRTEILKGVRAKEEPLALLLKAVQCIGCMTGDTVIYRQCEEDIAKIYGYKLRG